MADHGGMCALRESQARERVATSRPPRYNPRHARARRSPPDRTREQAAYALSYPPRHHNDQAIKRKPSQIAHPPDDRFHDVAGSERTSPMATKGHARRRRRTSGLPRLQQRRRATAPPGCGSGSFLLLLRAEGVARSHDCRRGISQAGSAACPTVRRRESNHAPGAGPPSICVIQMSRKQREDPGRVDHKSTRGSRPRLGHRSCARGCLRQSPPSPSPAGGSLARVVLLVRCGGGRASHLVRHRDVRTAHTK